MKQMESHPMFNPSIKVADVPQKEKKTLPVPEDKEDLSFKLFEQAEKEPPAEKGACLKELCSFCSLRSCPVNAPQTSLVQLSSSSQ